MITFLITGILIVALVIVMIHGAQHEQILEDERKYLRIEYGIKNHGNDEYRNKTYYSIR